MLIRDLEQQTGLDRATIRYYEKEGLIAPERKENGYRVYSEEILDDLVKIKLLRQLGFSLERIKLLQQGSEDLSSALVEQIKSLEVQISNTSKAKTICQQIYSDEASYTSLDAQYYLQQFFNISSIPSNSNPFRENRKIEIHPWRRFLARSIDNALVTGLSLFVYIVLLRIRPVSGLVVFTLSFTSLLLLIPLSAFTLHLWGTTPGKWIMGIEFEALNGERISIKDAIIRELYVFCFGLGMGIPIYQQWRLYQNYIEYRHNSQIDYDTNIEIIFRDMQVIRKAGSCLIVLACMLLGIAIAADSNRPVHLGTNLTVEQIIENYNAYNQIKNHDALVMDDNASWIISKDTIETFQAGNSYETQFVFETEGERVRKITYQDSWSIVSLSPWYEAYTTGPNMLLYGRCNYMACSIMAAQMNLLDDISRLEYEINSHASWQSHTINIKHLEISWEVETINLDENYRPIEKDQEGWVDFTFTITIND